MCLDRQTDSLALTCRLPSLIRPYSFCPSMYPRVLSSFFFPQLLSSTFFTLSLLVATQIRGHAAGSSSPSPHPHYSSCLHFDCENASALFFSPRLLLESVIRICPTSVYALLNFETVQVSISEVEPAKWTFFQTPPLTLSLRSAKLTYVQ